MNHKIKRQLTQILEICIQKQLNYQLSPCVFNVSVYSDTHSLSVNAYYHGELFDKEFTSGKTVTLSKMLKQVKEY